MLKFLFGNFFWLFSIGYKMVFFLKISTVSYSVAPLCSAKKLKFFEKIPISRYNQKSKNKFSVKIVYLTPIIY